MFAVLIATAGVIAVIRSSASIPEGSSERPEASRALPTATSPILGDLLTLIASVEYGLYQVLYKRYLTLPSDPEREELPRPSYAPIPRASLDDVRDTDPLIEDPTSGDSQSVPDTNTVVYPPPFGLHPNLLTSLVGVFTLLFLWIPLLVLHHTGTEPFRWPENWYAALVISGISLSGVISIGGFMVISWFSVCTARA